MPPESSDASATAVWTREALSPDAWTADDWSDVVLPLELLRPFDDGSLARPRYRDRRWVRDGARLLLLVLLPTLLIGGYFFGFAADRFVSEAKFLVRKPNAIGTGPTQSLSLDEGPKGVGTDDSYAVRDFMISRDAMRLLLDKAGLREAVGRATGDPLWRFPGLLNGASDEELFKVYQSLVRVDYESSTGVSTLHVEAFRPDDAQRIAGVLMNGAETLLNRLNERARTDAVQLATTEVARDRAKAITAANRLTAFRERESVIDPTKFSETVLATMGMLSMQLVDTAAALDVMQRAAPRSPQIAPLQGRVRALQGQIDRERATLAGGDMSLAPKIAEFERLALTRDFAQGNLISALNLLEAARLDRLRRQEYLEHVVEPGLPDKAHYPFRILWTAGTMFAGLSAFLLFRPAGAAPSGLDRRRG